MLSEFPSHTKAWHLRTYYHATTLEAETLKEYLRVTSGLPQGYLRGTSGVLVRSCSFRWKQKKLLRKGGAHVFITVLA